MDDAPAAGAHAAAVGGAYGRYSDGATVDTGNAATRAYARLDALQAPYDDNPALVAQRPTPQSEDATVAEVGLWQ